jgi:hypothetical protein
MSHTITVRLGKDLADRLARLAGRTGVPQGQLVRDQLEKARASGAGQPFLRLAGCVKGRPRDLSARKGFSGR